MGEPSEQEVRRGTAALVPFVQAWNLALNPENLDLMAYAVLRGVRSEASFEEIDQMARELIAEDAEADRRMKEAWERDLDTREDDRESD